MIEQLRKLYDEVQDTEDLSDLDNFLKSAAGDNEKLQSGPLLTELTNILLHYLDKGTARYELIELFLKYGVDPNFGKTNNFPLKLAVKHPNVKIEVVELLLKYKTPNSTRQDDKKYYTSVLKTALKNPNAGPDIIKLLLKHRAKAYNKVYWYRPDNSLLLIAVCSHDSNPKIVNLLLRYGSRVNFQGRNNNTALHYALQIEYINLDVVDTLLIHGANVNIANDDGITPLQFALKHCSASNEFVLLSNPVGDNTITNGYFLRQGVGDSRYSESIKQFRLEMCTMSILKHLVLNRVDCDFEQVSNSVSDVICKTFLDDECCRILSNHSDIPLLQELVSFLVLSVKELAKMKGHRIHSSFTMQDFLVQRNTLSIEKILFYMLKVLEWLNLKKYPIYKDVIRFAIFSIKRKHLLLRLEGMRIVNHRKQLALDFSVISGISEYLSKKDLFNLMLAGEKPVKKRTRSGNVIKTPFFGVKRLKLT